MSEAQQSHSRFALIFAAGTLLSRVLGFIRDIVLLVTIPQASKDAFFVAFKFPNMLRDLIGEGASNAAFVPIMSEYDETKSREEYRRLVRATMSFMLLVLAVLTVLGVLIVPQMLQGLNFLSPITGAKPLDQANIDLLVNLSRWTFPYLFMIGMAVFCMAPLFVAKHYSTPSWSPALLNVSIILSCFLFYGRVGDPAYAILIGVWLGGLAQMAVNYYALGRETGVWLPSLEFNHPGVRAMVVLLIPVLFGQAAGEVNKLVDTLFAASLGEGTVTALYFANRLVQLPLSLFGIATAVAILPSISLAGARGDHKAIRTTLMGAFRQAFYLACPAMLGLMVLGKPLIGLLQYKNFSPETAQKTVAALSFYAVGILAFSGVKIAVSGFYAVKDTKTPVLVASASMVLNIILNLLLVKPMGYKGLALATTISFTVNFAALYYILCDRFGKLWDSDFLFSLFRMASTAFLMIIIAYGVSIKLHQVFTTDTLAIRLTHALVPVAVAVVSYFGLSAALRIPEFQTLAGAFRGRRG